MHNRQKYYNNCIHTHYLLLTISRHFTPFALYFSPAIPGLFIAPQKSLHF